MNAPCLQSKDVNCIEVMPNFKAETFLFVSVSITVVHSVVLFFNTTYRGRAPRMPSRGQIAFRSEVSMKP
jgi:hypothetical protein